MKVRRFAIAGSLLTAGLMLQGCTVSKATCKASVDINQNNPSLKGECNWEFKGGRISQQTALRNMLGDSLGSFAYAMLGDTYLAQVQSFNPAAFDAGLLKMSTAGSGATIDAATGTFLIKLYSGTQIITASTFGWIRNGSDIIVANPSALNAWIRQYQSADGYEYGGVVPFNAGPTNSAAIYGRHSYNGSVVYTTTNSVTRPASGGRAPPQMEQ